MQQFVIASHNQAKVDELKRILQFYGAIGQAYTSLIAPQKFPPETTTSYTQNVETKAVFISRLLPNRYVLADDSGLELAAYPGKFGVQTAREFKGYSHGRQQNRHIIDLVNGRSRDFTMKTFLALAHEGQIIKIVEGQIAGQIAKQEQGEYSTGFDRVLIPNGQNKTLAEIPFTQRVKFLHRGRAVKNLFLKPDNYNDEGND